MTGTRGPQVGIRQRWKVRSEIVDFMTAMTREADRQRTEALQAGDEARADFYDGVKCAVLDCQRNGQPTFGWTEDTDLGRGWRRGWALITLGSEGVRAGVGLPPLVVPPFDTGGTS